jgi:hypothetical protein
MGKREILGTMHCPECDFTDAEIKAQKCGVKLYRYCPECNAQFFARTSAQEKNMRKFITKTPIVLPEKTTVQPVEEKPPVQPAQEKTKPKSSLEQALAFMTGESA